MRMKTRPGVRPGTYHGFFSDAAPTSHDDYGPGIRWDFQIDEGTCAGATVSRTTKDIASPANTCGKFWQMVSGLDFEAAAQCDTEEWTGATGTIEVEQSPSGDSVRVATFIRDDAK